MGRTFSKFECVESSNTRRCLFIVSVVRAFFGIATNGQRCNLVTGTVLLVAHAAGYTSEDFKLCLKISKPG